MSLLEETKTIVESALQLIYAARDAGGNAKATHTHQALSEAHVSSKVCSGLELHSSMAL